MNWLPINVNTWCEVELTDFGMEHLKKLGMRSYCIVNKGTRIVRASLWAIMSDFGPAHHFGDPKIPFVSNIIRIEDEREKGG